MKKRTRFILQWIWIVPLLIWMALTVYAQFNDTTTEMHFDNKVLCPVCQEKGLKSIVYEGSSQSTLLYNPTWYDEEGNRHYQNTNTTTTYYSCSQGHEWYETYCMGESNTHITKDTEDEPETYTVIEAEDNPSLYSNESFLWEGDIIDYTPATAVIFGDNVGKISWDEGVMEFEGDAFESARIFFEVILKSMIDGYIENKQKEGVSIIEDEELEEGTVSLAFGELEPEHILFQYATTGQFAKTFQPEWFLKIVDTDLSKCFVDNRLRLEINGKIYWIRLEAD